MTTATLAPRTLSTSNQATVVRAVTVIMGTVVGLTFLFGFGRSRWVRGFLMVSAARTRWGVGAIGCLVVEFDGLLCGVRVFRWL